MNTVRINSVVAVLLSFALAPATATAGPFSQGSQSVAIIAGSGSAFRDDYLILGLGYGYYVVDGLELGIDAQFWLSGDPSITKVSPQIRYVFTQPKTIKPYIGGFVRRTFISDFTDLDSVGYRAGLNFMGRGNFFFGAGFVYERYQDCNDAIVANCSDTYPEILFSFSI
jgi:hypothetical protein